MSGKQKKLIIISSVIAAVIAIAAGVMTYLLDYYPVDREAAKAASSGYCYVVEYGDDLKAYEPVGETNYGLIFIRAQRSNTRLMNRLWSGSQGREFSACS